MIHQNNIVTFFPKAVYCEDNVYSNLNELETSIKNLSEDNLAYTSSQSFSSIDNKNIYIINIFFIGIQILTRLDQLSYY